MIEHGLNQVTLPRPKISIMSSTLLILIAALVSLEMTGFNYGVANNIFHIPYVLDWAKSPEFKDDAFYASLKNFTSAVWPLLRLVSTESNIESVFRITHAFSRFAGFAAILFVVKTAGVRQNWGMVVCMMALAVTPWLRGYSEVGYHDMFIDSLTHSELTWVFVFLSLALLVKGRLVAAAAISGIAFLANAFVGIWLLCIGVFYSIFDDRKDWWRAAAALVCFVVVASPVILWIAFALQNAKLSIPFSFADYIREYYPNHFLIEAGTSMSICRIFLIVLAGLISCAFIENGVRWIRVQSACLAIFICGMPLPYIIDSRFVFNLHLLRIDGLIQAVAIVLTVVAAVQLIFEACDKYLSILGLIIVSSLIVQERSTSDLAICVTALLTASLLKNNGLLNWPDFISSNKCVLRLTLVAKRLEKNITFSVIIVWAVLVIYGVVFRGVGLSVLFRLMFLAIILTKAFGRFSTKFNDVTLFVGVLVFSCLASVFLARASNKKSISNDEMAWRALAGWIRSSDIHGVFLTPIHEGAGNFQLLARRSVWVDKKQGAAVMWQPSFYYQWHQRLAEVRSLVTPDDFVLYARSRGIHNVVVDAKSGPKECPESSTMIASSGSYFLCVI